MKFINTNTIRVAVVIIYCTSVDVLLTRFGPILRVSYQNEFEYTQCNLTECQDTGLTFTSSDIMFRHSTEHNLRHIPRF